MSESPFNPPIPPFPEIPLVENVLEAAAHLKSRVESRIREFSESAREKAPEWKESAQRLFDGSQGQWKEAADQAANYVKENPGKAVLAGLGAGFFIGLLFRSK